MADKLVLIDGHALAYRQFYALPLEAFTTQDGEPTNATYGFTRTVLDLMMSDDPPKYLAVSFDVGRTFRDDMFTDYKGTREKMPDELALQIERIRQVIRTMNIPVLELDGYEADDVLGTGTPGLPGGPGNQLPRSHGDAGDGPGVRICTARLSSTGRCGDPPAFPA